MFVAEAHDKHSTRAEMEATAIYHLADLMLRNVVDRFAKQDHRKVTVRLECGDIGSEEPRFMGPVYFFGVGEFHPGLLNSYFGNINSHERTRTQKWFRISNAVMPLPQPRSRIVPDMPYFSRNPQIRPSICLFSPSLS
jgi:hypothetical protein